MPSHKAILTLKGEKWISSGHPWIFRDDLAQLGDLENGAVIPFYSSRDKFLGWAFYSRYSRISLRRISRDEEVIDDSYWRKILEQAIQSRKKTLEFEDQACRLIFAEADGFPGLIADWYAGHLVLQTLIPGTERLLPMLTGLFQEILQPRSILLRNDIEARAIEKLPREVKVLTGEIPERVIVREGDIRYRVDLLEGQKTGAYLDQQENRKRLAGRTPRGGRVLDCFSYTGAFALHQAAEAGEVLAVDDSARAVEEGRENSRLNGLDRIRFIKDNIFDFLREAEKQQELFDLIILDPPPFARKKSEVAGGQRGYLELNRRAMGCLTPGGLLATYSCSHNFSEPLFLEMVREAGRKAGRKAFLLEKSLQSPDHPILLSFPESYYLKGVIVKTE
jgi:23S rRNA (cytosine1962-C5)-methyltransferase